jgi:hypothetical protein
MTWSYSIGDLASSAKDQLRLMIGDTVAASPQFQDEELAWFLSQRGSIWGAASLACQTLATQYARSADSNAGDTSLKLSQMAAAYARRSALFEAKDALLGGAMPYAGGISVADKQAQIDDSDRVAPQFSITLDDNLLPVPSDGNPSGSAG